MRIEGFHVDGFGLLHEARVEDVAAGLTVVLGPNEAGKSTLHAFLVRTLLGHPRAGNAAGRQRYEPLRGGRLGGSITVRDAQDGRWEVHRQPGRSPALRIVRPDGSETTSADAIDELVGARMDLERFEQVFAIDVDALSGLGSLEGEALQELLFDAATVGTGRSLRGARDEAVRRRDELWTARASTRPLTTALAARTVAERELAEARAAVASMGRRRAERDDAAAQVAALRAQQARAQDRIVLLRRVLDAWPAWQVLQAAGEDGGPGSPLSPTTVQAEADTRRAAAEARAALAERDDELATLDAAAAVVEVDEELVAVADQVRELHAQLAVHEVEVDRLATARATRGAAEQELAAALAALGPGWDEAALSQVATDVASHEALSVAADALGDARRHVELTGRTAADAVATVNRMLAGLERRRAGQAAAPDPEQVRTAEAAVTVLRARVPSLEREAQRESQRVVPGPSSGPGPIVWAVIGVAALALAVAAFVLGDGAAGLALGLVCLLGAVVSAYLAGRARAAGVEEPGTASRELAATITAEVRAAAGALGLDPTPTLAQVERVAGRVASARAQVETAAAVARELRDLEHEHEDARAASDQAAAAAGDAVEELMTAQQRWQQVCETVGVDPDEEPRVALARHGRAVEAARAADAVRRVDSAGSSLHDAVEAFRDEVAEVLRAAGVDVVDGLDAVRSLPAVHDRVLEDDEARRELARVAAERERVVARRDVHVKRLADAEAELARFWSAADVQDAEGFAARVAADRESSATSRERDEAAARVDELLGTGEESAPGRRVLATADPVGWDAELARLRDEVTRLDDARDEAVRTHATLAQQVTELGSDDAVPRAHQALTAAQAEVDELAERWAVADAAVRLLTATLERFEREQQPAVLAKASRLLSTATLGAWREVRRIDEQIVVARTPGGEPCEVDALSRGTREQLYLCLRLALAGELSRERHLPLLIDDLLGASDPQRAAAIARLLAEVAARHQVWLFTPHGVTAAMLQKAAPGARVLELARGGELRGWRGGAATPASPAAQQPSLDV